MELLDSIYNNYPIGSILLWSSHERLKSSRNIGGLKLPDRGASLYCSLRLRRSGNVCRVYFAVFSSQREYEAAKVNSSPDPNLFEISFRFDDESLSLHQMLTHQDLPLSYQAF